MSNGTTQDDNTGYFLLACIVVIALIILQFSRAINVDFATGFNVFVRLCGVAGLCFLALKLGVPLIAIVPGLVAGLFTAFFPAFDYWAFGSTPFAFELEQPAFYARWYSKALCILIPTVVGYGYLYRKYWQ